ncbi:unnamed protein product, partial [Discosporangium mesarthrocarpum]
GGVAQCRGVSLSTAWPLRFVRATLGAGYQQVAPSTPPAQDTSSRKGVGVSRGGEGGFGGGGGLDMVTLSGGLAKYLRLPSLGRGK